MIAVPVDQPRLERASVSNYLGDVAYFALYNSRGQWQRTVANEGRGGGQALSRFLAAQGVREVLFRHLGDKLYGWLRREGIVSFALADPQMPIELAVRALRERRLEQASDATIGRLLHPAGPGNGHHCEAHD